MTKPGFPDAPRRRLAGMPQPEIDDVIADYATHFADGMAEGRSKAEIAQALGDPMRFARELRAEAGFRRWEQECSLVSFFAVLFRILALVAVDFVFLLPLMGGLFLFSFIAGVAFIALCIAGLAALANVLSWHLGAFAVPSLTRALGGLGLTGISIGGSALPMLMIDYVVRLLGRFARLHFTLLHKADLAARRPAQEARMIRSLDWIARPRVERQKLGQVIPIDVP